MKESTMGTRFGIGSGARILTALAAGGALTGIPYLIEVFQYSLSIFLALYYLGVAIVLGLVTKLVQRDEGNIDTIRSEGKNEYGFSLVVALLVTVVAYVTFGMSFMFGITLPFLAITVISALIDGWINIRIEED